MLPGRVKALPDKDLCGPVELVGVEGSGVLGDPDLRLDPPEGSLSFTQTVKSVRFMTIQISFCQRRK